MTAPSLPWFRLDNEARDLLLANVKKAESLRDVAKMTGLTYTLSRSDKAFGVSPVAWCGWHEMGMFRSAPHRIMEATLFTLAEALLAWKPRTAKGKATRIDSLKGVVHAARNKCTIEGANEIKALIPIVDDEALS